MSASRETLESLKQGNALKIETLELMKAGANKAFDDLIAQTYKDDAACDQLAEDLNGRRGVSNGSTPNAARKIIALLRRELQCLKREDKRCLERYLATDKLVREKYRHKMDVADAAQEDLPMLQHINHILRACQHHDVFDYEPFGPRWKTFTEKEMRTLSIAVDRKKTSAMLLDRKREEESYAELDIDKAWDKYWLDLHDLYEREDRLAKIIELVERNFT